MQGRPEEVVKRHGHGQIMREGARYQLLILQYEEGLEGVEERNARNIPEVQHPPILLSRHVPGCWDVLLPLDGCVRVQPVRLL